MRHSFLSARFKRVCARRGYSKAVVATQHSMIVAIWHMLSTGEPYHDLGGDASGYESFAECVCLCLRRLSSCSGILGPDPIEPFDRLGTAHSPHG